MTSRITRLRREVIKPRKKAWYNAVGLALGATSQLPDISGNGLHSLVQATANKQPNNTAAQKDGRPALVFDNGDTLALPPSLYPLMNGAHTYLVVAKRATEAAATDVMVSFTEGGNYRGFVRFESTSGQINFAGNTSGSSSATQTGLTNTEFEIVLGRRRGPTQALSVNGGAENVNAFGASEDGIDAAYIGSRADIDSYLAGSIGEIIFYDYSLTAMEARMELQEASQRWGIPLV